MFLQAREDQSLHHGFANGGHYEYGDVIAYCGIAVHQRPALHIHTTYVELEKSF